MIEYGLLLIKPDGVGKCIEKLCENEIEKHKLEIVKKKYTVLSEEMIRENFYYKFKEYIQYMCSGPVCVYLLKSENIDMDEILYIVKNKIRTRFGLSGKVMKNLVHATHCGTEFFVQRDLFFPEYKKLQYNGVADLLVKPKNINNKFYLRMDEVINKSNIDIYGIIITQEKEYSIVEWLMKKYPQKEFIVGKEEEIFLEKFSGTLIRYIGNNYCDSGRKEKKLLTTINKIYNFSFNNDKMTNATNVLSYAKYNEEKAFNEIKSMIEVLHKDGIYIDAMVVNSAEMDINEAEIRYEVSNKLGLIPVGGSYDWNEFGLFAMSNSKVEKLLERLWY